MNETHNLCEQLSALADGELQGDEFAQAMGHVATPEGQAIWAMYHLVGDVLRTPALAQHGQRDLLAALRTQIAQEPQRPQFTPQAQVLQLARKPAANVALLRWKMVAGFASLAAVSALGWNVALGLRGEAGPGALAGAQLAAAVPATPVPAVAPNQVLAVADLPSGPQLMLRDPRLDELIATHNQYHGANNLQVPAEFLRNATFAAPVTAPQR
jgi:sigma-E factor negative regulatory protein RseA